MTSQGDISIRSQSPGLVMRVIYVGHEGPPRVKCIIRPLLHVTPVVPDTQTLHSLETQRHHEAGDTLSVEKLRGAR